MLAAIDPALARRAAIDGLWFFLIVIGLQLFSHVKPQILVAFGIGVGIACLRYPYLQWRMSKVAS